MAITCDEGVYHIAREIKLTSGDEFSNLTLCLGSFHMAKILLGCVGKNIRNSGAESIWVESGIFGQHVVQSVLARSHYARSVVTCCFVRHYKDFSGRNSSRRREFNRIRHN